MKTLLVFFLLSAPSFATENSIKVQGSCEMKVSPDRARVSFTAENQSKDQKEAASKTMGQINQLKEKIQSLKLAHLELNNSGYNVSPVQEWVKDRMIHKGIKVQLTLEVTTSEISRLGEVLGMANDLGITNASSLQAFLSLDKNREEYAKCLEIAAENAQHKARRLAKKLGFRVGEVLQVIETQPSPSGIPRPLYAMSMDAVAEKTAKMPTQIEAQAQDFSTSVEVSFSIR